MISSTETHKHIEVYTRRYGWSRIDNKFSSDEEALDYGRHLRGIRNNTSVSDDIRVRGVRVVDVEIEVRERLSCVEVFTCDNCHNGEMDLIPVGEEWSLCGECLLLLDVMIKKDGDIISEGKREAKVEKLVDNRN